MREISVIATVLNEAASIERLVQSLAVQTTQPKEIVIVDGGSTDGTWETLERLAATLPLLRVIRDESCSLQHSPGPIARGRNVAIAAASGDLIACCDAGCSYAPEWLEKLAAPFDTAGVEYVLGGSRIDPAQATAWDLAAAPLMGLSLASEGQRRSCTARSMAFTRGLWERAGKFPETTLLGEDTWFDLRAGELTARSYADSAMAVYEPRWDFAAAAHTLARYSSADGALQLRKSRFAKMVARCVLQVGTLVALYWTYWPLVIVALIELYVALERDRTVLKPSGWRGLLPRVLFSMAVPWIVCWHYGRGARSGRSLSNPQNA